MLADVEDGLVWLGLQAFGAIGRFEADASSSLSVPLDEDPELEPPVEDPDEFRSEDLLNKKLHRLMKSG